MEGSRKSRYTIDVAHELRNDDDVEAILRIAVNQAGLVGGQSMRERLMQAADELGLTPEQIAEAEKKYFIEKREKEELEEFKAVQRRDFFGHLTAYIIVNAFFVALNFWTTGGFGWAIWSILGWGIGLAFNFVSSMLPKSESFQSEFRGWQKKKRRREAKKAKGGLEPLPPLDD